MSTDLMTMTRANPWRKARLAGFTGTTFPSRIPTVTEPSGEGVVDLTNEVVGGVSQNLVEFIPYAQTGGTNPFSCRAIGWSCLQTSGLSPVTPETNLWIPVVLCELLCESSSTTGVGSKATAKAVRAAEFFAGGISVVGTTANPGSDVNVTSPASTGLIANAVVDLVGFQKLEFTFSSPLATDCNALFRLF
jgi:hypothetical protein